MTKKFMKERINILELQYAQLSAEYSGSILQVVKLKDKVDLLQNDMVNYIKSNKEWSDKYNNISDQYNSISNQLNIANDEIVSLKLYNNCDTVLAKQKELEELQSQINEIKSANYIQTLGMYDLKYDSKHYRIDLDKNRSAQKLMLIKHKYFTISESWFVNGNSKEGKSLMDFILRISVTSFNLTCDSIMDNTNIVNSQSIIDRITKIFNNYNKELNKYKVELSTDYLNLKLDEVQIRLNIYIAKQNEKEEESRRKEILKEQIRAELEINKSKEKLNKELLHYQIQLNKGADVQDKIDEIESKIETEDYMLANNRSGWLYIVNNPSLGRDVYKIGISRRCEINDRFKELSGSNIPFAVRPNCIIWCEDCFVTESALHKEFDKYRVNKIKTHREFFKLPLSQIEKVVKEKYYPQAIFDYDVIDEDFLASGYKLSENFIDK